MNTEIGISTLIFRESNLATALEKIRQTILRKIDLTIILPTFCPHYNPLITTEHDDVKLKEQIESHGIIVSTINIVPGYYNTDPPEEVDLFIKRAVDIAAKLSAHSVTIPSGYRCNDESWEQNVLSIKRHLLEVNKYAQDNNIYLSIETPHVRTLTETLRECERFYEILGEPTIKCTLDTSHVRRLEKYHPLDAVKLFGLDRINHIHLRDTIGEEIAFTPGKGTCDFKSFFEYLNKKNYHGDYILELEYEDITEIQKMSEINFALEYCRELLTKGELSISKKIQTNKKYQTVERFFRNPKAEIKRHKRILSYIRSIKPKVLPYMPEKVYDGKWSTKIRWRKGRVITHKKNSVKLRHKAAKKIRVGIVGCGWAGMEMHAPGFYRLEDVDIIAVYDIDSEKTIACASKFGSKPCKNLDELIREKPDLISICTREWAHYEPVVKALQNGIDVFCEKLLATKYSHGLEMVNAAKKYNRILGVNYNYHYIPGIRKIREVIEQQVLGQLALFNINVHAFSYAHALDLFSFLGGRIASVSAQYNNIGNREFGGTDWSLYDDDILYIPSGGITVSVEFDNGAVGVVNSSNYYNLNSFVMSVEAVFEGGVISLSGINMYNILGELSYICGGNKIRKVDMNYKRGVYSKGYEYTFYESIKDFIEFYVEGKPVPTTGEKALYNMRLEKMIAKSNKERIKIRL